MVQLPAPDPSYRMQLVELVLPHQHQHQQSKCTSENAPWDTVTKAATINIPLPVIEVWGSSVPRTGSDGPTLPVQ